ncbi:FUSC family protein [Actinoallomurus rhizosphaericola]|uniref:FUSC family protein n=1 Tax=Actinoallomurus rhizosphaericola TaxID=2952536 RepID=UPI0020921424|nr:FUSC family protein [Actinoallomurus rhizosphaericola]MCO5994930.1 FUSC family protein [Actinoallomurus rhizosphaericola]
MRSSLAWLRETYAESEGRASPMYGVVASVGIATPLVIGTVTGHPAQGGVAALGAFFVVNTTPQGPYGARARALLAAVLVVTGFSMLGGLLAGHPTLAVAVVPVVAAVAAAVPWLGVTATLVMIAATVRPAGSPVFFDGFLEMIGGLYVSLLMVVPLLTRRLQPLRTALAEAGGSVAFALDLLAEPEPRTDEWERRRRQAYDDINKARTTYGLYLSGGRDDEQRPRRLIEAFNRVMDEAVALRTLLDAARQASPPEEWERERRVAVAAMAARLRLVVGGIEAGGGTPLGADQPVALHRFARVSEDVRQAWLADDLVRTALIVQVRQSISRMAATVDGARETIAPGLKIGIDSPRLPERPTGGWSRFVEGIRTRSPGFRHSTRMGVAIAVAMALSAWLRLPHGHWLTITVVASLRDSYGDTVTRVVKRIGGTAIGAIVAALALVLVPHQGTLIGLVFVGAALGFTVRPVNFGHWMAVATPMIMLLIDYSAPLSWHAAAWRIGLTAAGGLFALAAARVLWPAGTIGLLPGRLARLMRTHAALARAVAARFDGEAEASIRRRMEDAAAAAADVEESATRLGQEPAPPEDLVRRLLDATSIARRLRDDVQAVGALWEDRTDAGPLPAILERVADQLEESADALLSADGEAAELRLDDLLEEFDRHLAELTRRRRAELDDGVGTDAVTTLRRSLVQVAAARHALRGLASDAERLRRTVLTDATP